MFMGLFGLCNVFHTHWRLHFMGLFVLRDGFCIPQDCTLRVFLAFITFFLPPRDLTLWVFLAPSGFQISLYRSFWPLQPFFVSPGDFRSHSTGLFRLCKIFDTPQDFRHFMGLFGLCNIFVYPQDCILLGFLAFVMFFVTPLDRNLQGFLIFVTFFYLSNNVL